MPRNMRRLPDTDLTHTVPLRRQSNGWQFNVLGVAKQQISFQGCQLFFDAVQDCHTIFLAKKNFQNNPNNPPGFNITQIKYKNNYKFKKVINLKVTSYHVRKGVYKVPYRHPLPWVGNFIKSVREEYQVVMTGREYQGCGEEYYVN